MKWTKRGENDAQEPGGLKKKKKKKKKKKNFRNCCWWRSALKTGTLIHVLESNLARWDNIVETVSKRLYTQAKTLTELTLACDYPWLLYKVPAHPARIMLLVAVTSPQLREHASWQIGKLQSDPLRPSILTRIPQAVIPHGNTDCSLTRPVLKIW